MTAAWVFAGTLLYFLLTNFAPFVLALTVVAPLLLLGRRVGEIEFLRASSLNLLLIASATYLLINATWSPVPLDAYRSIATFIVAIVALNVTIPALGQLEDRLLLAMATGFYAAYAVIAVFAYFEAASDLALHRTLFAALPQIRPYIRGAVLEGNIYTYIPDYFLNRKLSVLTLMLWPAVLAALCIARSWSRRMLAGLAFVPAVAAVSISHHATSKVALAGGALMFALHRYAPRLGAHMAAIAWVTACVAVVPLALAAYANNLQTSDWLFPTAQHRVVIWGYTSQQVANAPVLGAGMSAARAPGDLEAGPVPLAPGTPFPFDDNIHSHNAYLQVWYETGAVGAVLLLCVGVLVVRTMSRQPADSQSALFAMFASHALVAAFGFSIWAPWLLASFPLAAIFASLSIVLSRREQRASRARPKDS